jgi:uncharacterized protein (TIGR00106 family)
VAIAEINIIPLGTPGPGVADYIADAVRLLKRRGIPFEVTAMGTVIEAKVDKILELAREMHEVTFGKDVCRVVTTITIDDRRDREASARDKVEAVSRRLAGGTSEDAKATRETGDED